MKISRKWLKRYYRAKKKIKKAVGLRTLKTTIAVFLCVLISGLLLRDSAFYSSIAAVICLQKTRKKTYIVGRNRIFGTILGGAMGLIALLIAPQIDLFLLRLIFIPLFTFILIILCNKLKITEAISISSVVLYAILLADIPSTSESFMYVLNRVLDTSLGIVIAVGLNSIKMIEYVGDTEENIKNNIKNSINTNNINK